MKRTAKALPKIEARKLNCSLFSLLMSENEHVEIMHIGLDILYIT